jgi:hypothetical protein
LRHAHFFLSETQRLSFPNRRNHLKADLPGA